MISLQSALPALNSNIYIDATTESGYAGTPLVVLDGTAVPPSETAAPVGGLSLSGDDAVSGLSIVNFPSHGILAGSGGSDTIADNYIGLEPDGTVAGNVGDGVFVDNTASNLIEGNIISGNDAAGVEVGNRDGFYEAPARRP